MTKSQAKKMFGMYTQVQETDERNVNICLRLRLELYKKKNEIITILVFTKNISM